MAAGAARPDNPAMNTPARDLWRERADQMRARELLSGDGFAFAETSPRSAPGDLTDSSLKPSRGGQILARRRRQRVLAWCAAGAVLVVIVLAALYLLSR